MWRDRASPRVVDGPPVANEILCFRHGDEDSALCYVPLDQQLVTALSHLARLHGAKLSPRFGARHNPEDLG